MIDLHSHILPGLDDGARDLDEAVEIARAAVADGTRVIAATPHVREDYPTTSSSMQNGVAALRAALTRAGIDLVVLPGGEIALEQLDRLSVDDLRRFGLGGNPSYLLLETPYYDWPLAFGEAVFDLAAAGITPIIGHPERNTAVEDNPERIAELVRAGALVQLTAASIDGRLGKPPRACARRLLDAELVHLIGSDAHSPACSPACAADRLSRRAGLAEEASFAAQSSGGRVRPSDGRPAARAAFRSARGPSRACRARGKAGPRRARPAALGVGAEALPGPGGARRGPRRGGAARPGSRGQRDPSRRGPRARPAGDGEARLPRPRRPQWPHPTPL